MSIIRTITAAAVLTTGFAASAPASAVVTTFASYSAVGGANIYWMNNGGTTLATTGGSLYTIASPTSTTAGIVATKFKFLSPNALHPLTFLAALGEVNADFTLNVTAANGGAGNGGSLSEIIGSGGFSFIYRGAATLHVNHSSYATGANLLTATLLAGPELSGRRNSTSGGVDGSSSAGDAITYTSDFLNFGVLDEKDFSISITSITPKLGNLANRAINTFAGVSGGQFSTDPGPTLTAIVPEPATWGLLVVGFGLVGLQGRRRSRSSSVAA